MKRLTYVLLFTFAFTNLNAQPKKLSQDEIEEIVETNFLLGAVPKRYYSNILIELQGNPIKDDEIIVQNLVDQLNPLIENWDIYLVSEGKANNLIIKANNGALTNNAAGTKKIVHRKYEIISRTLILNELKPELDFDERKKIIRYNLLRALLQSTSSYKLKERIPGSVFSEHSPAGITFSPADFQIIKAAYSKKYDGIYDKILLDNPSAKNIIGGSKKTNLKRNPQGELLKKHWNIIVMLTNLLGIIASVWLITYFFNKGFFKKHHYNFSAFLKQGLLILGVSLLHFSFYFIAVFIRFTLLYFEISKVILPIITLAILFVVFGSISILIIYYAERRILKNNDNLMLGVMFPLAASIVVPSFLISIAYLVLPEPSAQKTPSEVAFIFFGAISIFSLFGILRAIYIYLSKKSESLIHQKDVELAKLGELHKQAELQSLRSKINPHFLYNSLNSIASLAHTNPEKTEQMALSLSDFFKYSINREQKQMNSLAEELEAVKTYLEIEKVRFDKRLTFEIDCPENLLKIKIPQLLIQPFVENSIKHGISKRIKNGEIIIRIRNEERKLKIRIGDNGPAFPDGPLSGFGIRNTNERLKLVYGEKASINWENGDEKFIEITLPV